MNTKKKHTLYLIGGPMRVGKTIIGMKMLRRKPMVALSTDGIRGANRSLLLGKPGAHVKEIRFACDAMVAGKNGKGLRAISFARKGMNQDDLAWESALGFIDSYDWADRVNLLIEGVAITPERVHRLKLRHLSLRAIFVGYSGESHAASIFAHADKKKDWVYEWLKKGGDRAEVKDWVLGGISQSALFKKQAEKFGYGYFDLSLRPFREHVRAVLNYLLEI
jgi:2-phosphoglycerate kinase